MTKSKNIPKVIHYFWFGGNTLPTLAERCIESWKKYLPDYEIKEWNESNFDVNANAYSQQAYLSKKYAFVSDYARLHVLHEYGGIYLDTDVEVIRPFDDILKNGYFMGLEPNEAGVGAPSVALGLGFACAPGLDILKELVDSYNNDKFIRSDGSQNLTTIVQRTTGILKKHGFVEKNEIQRVGDFIIYPTDYFCPKDFATGKLAITKNTHSIHWYDASWQPKSSRIYYSFTRHLPLSLRVGLKRLAKTVKGRAR